MQATPIIDEAASKSREDMRGSRTAPDSPDRKVVVRPDGESAWVVEWSDGRSVLARKTEAVKMAREITKNIPGRSTLVVLKVDGSEASTTAYGSDRPPMKSYLQA